MLTIPAAIACHYPILAIKVEKYPQIKKRFPQAPKSCPDTKLYGMAEAVP
jgi:hypothetical protein